MGIFTAAGEGGSRRTGEVERGKAGITTHCLPGNLPRDSRPLWKRSCCYLANQVLFLFPLNRNVTLDLVACFRAVTVNMIFPPLLPSLRCPLNFWSV